MWAEGGRWQSGVHRGKASWEPQTPSFLSSAGTSQACRGKQGRHRTGLMHDCQAGGEETRRERLSLRVRVVPVEQGTLHY